jgi:uncharacterized membrane protein
LADGRQFVAGISSLDALAAAAGLTVISGASSVPALSSAVIADLARTAEQEGSPMPASYRSYARLWFWLGLPAFTAVVLIFWIMVTKPRL